jgi:hypothetical protein
MTDVPPEMHNGNLPACPFSAHYERLLEDLDTTSTSLHDDVLRFEGNDHDRELLLQLQAHQPGCPTCTVILARARTRRYWQRQQLRSFLNESEKNVPSSTARILQALAREPQPLPATHNGHKKSSENEEDIFPLPFPNGTPQRQRPKPRSRKLLQNVLAFVAVLALLLTSFSLFSHLLVFHSANVSTAPQKAPVAFSVLHATTWSSVIIAIKRGGKKIITSTDPITGNSVVLASSDYPDGTTLDGVSHDGYEVLYHVFDGSETRYYLQPSTQNALLYTVSGKGGPAVWSTDDSSLFISVPAGVEKIDMQSRAATLVISSLTAPDLRFYRDGYLYFAASSNAGASMWLNRINLAQGDITPITEGVCPLSYDFWPSPSGATVYYRCNGQTTLYTVNNDGTGTRALRTTAGRMMGYTAQGEPLTLLRMISYTAQGEPLTTFQVVKLGLSAPDDQTLVADIAPGAADLSVDTIAVAPYGFSLVALAPYAGGSEKLWYNDLVLHTQSIISPSFDMQQSSSLELGGWSRLQVAPSSSGK